MARLKRTQKLNQILQQSRFRKLYGGASQLQNLDLIVKLYLSDNLKLNSQVTRYEKGILTISVNSGAWATQLRYQAPSLKQQLTMHPEFSDLQSIKNRVIKGIQAKKAAQFRPMKKLSPENAELFRSAAEATEDPELSKALAKLAKNI